MKPLIGILATVTQDSTKTMTMVVKYSVGKLVNDLAFGLKTCKPAVLLSIPTE